MTRKDFMHQLLRSPTNFISSGRAVKYVAEVIREALQVIQKWDLRTCSKRHLVSLSNAWFWCRSDLPLEMWTTESTVSQPDWRKECVKLIRPQLGMTWCLEWLDQLLFGPVVTLDHLQNQLNGLWGILSTLQGGGGGGRRWSCDLINTSPEAEG